MCLFPSKLDVNRVMHKQRLLLQGLSYFSFQVIQTKIFFYGYLSLLLEEYQFPEYSLNSTYLYSSKMIFPLRS